ncbi:hypothetical protein K435DRAFT_861846 [Dendrothele bispora CBS 962.96]|uniref:Ubiquitin-like protease family profile domain-containing protein n=1 Tax=Dendrothele bispora (strain CBS 962.96) TaxID=1314807 RepID=A0A4S8LUK5_DENBC|nr:hypothetical protein K435DRAFT_861846 [Dendrothele bispora CBS 962.96]
MHVIFHGNSLGSVIDNELKLLLQWWTHEHFGKDFMVCDMPIAKQDDTYSCSLFAWGALEAFLLSDPECLGESEKPEGLRLRAFLRVIKRHYDQSFVTASQDYQFTFQANPTVKPLNGTIDDTETEIPSDDSDSKYDSDDTGSGSENPISETSSAHPQPSVDSSQLSTSSSTLPVKQLLETSPNDTGSNSENPTSQITSTHPHPSVDSSQPSTSSRSFVHSFLYDAMRWSPRKSTQAAHKLPDDWKDQCENSFLRKVFAIKQEDMLPKFFVNSDQTQMFYALGDKMTWAEEGVKQVEVEGANKK